MEEIADVQIQEREPEALPEAKVEVPPPIVIHPPIVIEKFQKDDYEGLKWVMKALGKGGDHYHLDYLFVIGKHACGTDGHRLHCYKPKMLIPTGNYRVTADKKQIILVPSDVTAPDIVHVFPKGLPKKIIAPGRSLSYTYTITVRAMDAGETVEIKYLDQLTEDCCGKIRYFGDGRPLWMKDRRRSGLVMPMRF